jgi:hypothetical protein
MAMRCRRREWETYIQEKAVWCGRLPVHPFWGDRTTGLVLPLYMSEYRRVKNNRFGEVRWMVHLWTSYVGNDVMVRSILTAPYLYLR